MTKIWQNFFLQTPKNRRCTSVICVKGCRKFSLKSIQSWVIWQTDMSDHKVVYMQNMDGLVLQPSQTKSFIQKANAAAARKLYLQMYMYVLPPVTFRRRRDNNQSHRGYRIRNVTTSCLGLDKWNLQICYPYLFLFWLMYHQFHHRTFWCICDPGLARQAYPSRALLVLLELVLSQLKCWYM